MPIFLQPTRALLVALLLTVCSALHAHEHWLQAQPWVAADGEAVEISLHVGQDLVGDSMPNILARYTEFSYTLDGGRADVPGVMGRIPAGIIEDAPSGTFVVGYQSVRQFGPFERAKFMAYLEQEGLAPVTLPPGSRDIAEHYTRFSKALVRSGDTKSDRWRENFGFRIELHSLQDPYEKSVGETLDLRLTWEGQPAEGLLVKAFCALRPEAQQRSRSDADGRVSIEIDCPGTWLVNAVKLLPASPGAEVDFESFWASLTFAAR